MTIQLKSFIAASALTLGISSAALAEDVTLRFLASHGGVSAHELAYDLGYFEGTGITLENVGYAGGGPESLFALASGWSCHVFVPLPVLV